MDQKQRLAKILELLEQREQLSQEELAKIFSVSKDTARRDILMLTEQGLAERYRGGVSLPLIKAKIEKYSERLVVNSKEKELIARKAVSLIKDNYTVLLDVSTTVNFMAKYMSQKNLFIVTHSIDNAISFSSSNKDNKIFLLGGYFNSESHVMQGYSILEQLSQFCFDYAFIGASGINSEGIFYSDLEDIHVRKSIISNSKNVCIVLDESKFNQTSPFKIGFEGIDTIITNNSIPSHIQKKISEYGIKLIIASEEE
jgi:DeoR family transcriptional regulator, carbon catabolite repression regulator